MYRYILPQTLGLRYRAKTTVLPFLYVQKDYRITFVKVIIVIIALSLQKSK